MEKRTVRGKVVCNERECEYLEIPCLYACRGIEAQGDPRICKDCGEYALANPQALEAVEAQAAKVPALERDVRHILHLLQLVCCEHGFKENQMPCYGEACEPCEIGKWIRAH